MRDAAGEIVITDRAFPHGAVQHHIRPDDFDVIAVVVLLKRRRLHIEPIRVFGVGSRRFGIRQQGWVCGRNTNIHYV